MNGNWKESLIEIEDLVKSMSCVSFDKSNGQYIAAYNHIIHSSYAYIALSMNMNNYEEVRNTFFSRSIKIGAFYVCI